MKTWWQKPFSFWCSPSKFPFISSNPTLFFSFLPFLFISSMLLVSKSCSSFHAMKRQAQLFSSSFGYSSWWFRSKCFIALLCLTLQTLFHPLDLCFYLRFMFFLRRWFQTKEYWVCSYSFVMTFVKTLGVSLSDFNYVLRLCGSHIDCLQEVAKHTC